MNVIVIRLISIILIERIGRADEDMKTQILMQIKGPEIKDYSPLGLYISIITTIIIM